MLKHESGTNELSKRNNTNKETKNRSFRLPDFENKLQFIELLFELMLCDDAEIHP
jgi:hypothetical protein